MAHEHHANTLPAELNAPLLINSWRRRAMVVGGIFAVLSIVLAGLSATVEHDGINHLLRSYLLGYIFSWGVTVGGLALFFAGLFSAMGLIGAGVESVAIGQSVWLGSGALMGLGLSLPIGRPLAGAIFGAILLGAIQLGLMFLFRHGT